MNDRTELTRNRLTAYLLSMGVEPAIVSAETWNTYPLPDSHQHGWLPPILTGTTPPMRLAFCPEIIVDQTAHLDDSDWDTYLEILEFVLARHIQYFIDSPKEVLEDRSMRISDELFERNAEAAMWFWEIQARALDALR